MYKPHALNLSIDAKTSHFLQPLPLADTERAGYLSPTVGHRHTEDNPTCRPVAQHRHCDHPPASCAPCFPGQCIFPRHKVDPHMPDNYANIAARHGLLGILSGQVIWNLVEDAGASPDEVEQFMDWYFAWREHLLETLQRIDEIPSGFVAFRVCKGAHACDACDALDGICVPASLPGLMEKLPPYAIGCRCLPESCDSVPADCTLTTALPDTLPTPRPCCRSLPITEMLHLFQTTGRFSPAQVG